MNIYVRKVLKHDITHQISITKEVLEDYFGNPANNDSIVVKGKKSHFQGQVTFLLATDPRFGGEIKQIIKAEGDMQVGDMLLFSKVKEEYNLEVVSVNDDRYPVINTLFGEEKRHLILNLDDNIEKTSDEENSGNRVLGGINELYYGVPGAGKSYTINERIGGSKYERVVFHPDYTYSDFVGQIMPKLKKSENGEEKLSYEFIPGPFTKAFKMAVDNPGEMFYLVIEEINRGNAPAIFGDIFQLLDRKDDGSGEYYITNFDIAREVYGDESAEIRMPSNLSLLATMNTSDQNVFTLDTAFQRRWDMKYIDNDVMKAEHANDAIEHSNVSWGGFASVINEEILEYNADISSSEDKQLGAYFVTQNELNAGRFPEKALKYLWDDAFKMDRGKVFDVSIKSIGDLMHCYTVEIQKGQDPIKRVMRAEVYKKMIDKSAVEVNEAADEE